MASGERKHRHRSLDNHHPKYTLLFGERSELRDSLIGAASFFLFLFSHLMLCTDRSLLIRSQFEQKQKPEIITFPLGMFALRILRTQIRSFEGFFFFFLPRSLVHRGWRNPQETVINPIYYLRGVQQFSKDKLDKHVVGSIYELFVLLIACFRGGRGHAWDHLIGCGGKFLPVIC